MKPEDLHDAIGALPDDLLTSVEALRKKKTVHWNRWAALVAACLLILAIPFALPEFRGVATESAKGDFMYSNENAAPENAGIYGDAAGDLANRETFRAEVLAVTENTILVKPLEGEQELRSSDKIYVSLPSLKNSSEIAVGDTVEITYSGILQETYPASAVGVTDIRIVK